MFDADAINPRTAKPGVVRALIEIPRGCQNKIEYDHDLGLFRLDRYLFASSHYPGDYGFVPQTLAADGDALDILIMVNQGSFTGCLIESRIIGVFKMRDRGQDDRKILAVPDTDPLQADIKTLNDVPTAYLREVEHFFLTYKQLDGVPVEHGGWAGRDDAIDAVEKAITAFAAKTRTMPLQPRHPGVTTTGTTNGPQ